MIGCPPGPPRAVPLLRCKLPSSQAALLWPGAVGVMAEPVILLDAGVLVAVVSFGHGYLPPRGWRVPTSDRRCLPKSCRQASPGNRPTARSEGIPPVEENLGQAGTSVGQGLGVGEYATQGHHLAFFTLDVGRCSVVMGWRVHPHQHGISRSKSGRLRHGLPYGLSEGPILPRGPSCGCRTVGMARLV